MFAANASSTSRKRTAGAITKMLSFTTTFCLMAPSSPADGFTIPVQPSSQPQHRINPPLSSTLFDEVTSITSTSTPPRSVIDPASFLLSTNAWNFDMPPLPTPPPHDVTAAAMAVHRQQLHYHPSSSFRQEPIMIEESLVVNHLSRNNDDDNNDQQQLLASFAATTTTSSISVVVTPTPAPTNSPNPMVSMQQQFEEAMFNRHGAVEQQNNLGSTSLSRQQAVPPSSNEEDTGGIGGGSNSSTGSKTMIRRATTGRSRVHASVRETGYDSINQYLKSACNHDLLNRNEEIILGREIQILTKYEAAREALETTLERPPTYAEWAADLNVDSVATLKKQIRRSLRAKAALTESNIRLVVSIAKRYRYKGLSFQDMAQEGILGLTKACEKFDPERGFRFSTYASWWIKQSVMRAISDQGRMIRLPVHIHDRLSLLHKTERNLNMELGRDPTIEEIAQRMDMPVERVDFLRRVSVKAGSLEDSVKSSKSTGSAAGLGGGDGLKVLDRVDDPESLDPNDVASYQMLRDDVSRLISTLNSREQAVVRMRYGLDDGRPKTLEEIGERFSVTRERIRQIEARALNKLRQPYRNHSVECYVKDYS